MGVSAWARHRYGSDERVCEAIALAEEWADGNRPAGLSSYSKDSFRPESAYEAAYEGTVRTLEKWPTSKATEYQLVTLHDIFGNPFRPALLDPVWVTSTVRSLAHGIYIDRAFDRLPILADALQDAGCESPDLLDHLRGPGPHVKGCWALDLVLEQA